MPAKKNAVKTASGQIERERLVSLINSMSDGVIAIDEDTKIVTHNGAALNIIDINGSIDGKPVASVLNLSDKNNQEINITQEIKSAKTPISNRDWRLKYSDGSFINLYTSISPVHLGYGNKGKRGYVIILRDITREKSFEEERDEFISVVSHELRTPIAIAEGNISNALYIFNKTATANSEMGQALQQAHDQIVFLAAMMNDLATLSRAERNKLVLEIEPVNVNKLLSELKSTYAREAEGKSLDFRIEIDSSLEILHTGKLYLAEILQNFITNAIKYTESGFIIVGAKQKQKGVEFYVSDSGIGISKPDQDQVFDKFFRSEDYRTRKSNGTGLGLYVAVKLADLIDADLSLRSELNEGSTFSIFVPDKASR